jgi:neutral trehalase
VDQFKGADMDENKKLSKEEISYYDRAMECIKILDPLATPYMIPLGKFKELYASD